MARWKLWEFEGMHVCDWHTAKSDQEKIGSLMFRRHADGMICPPTLLMATKPNLISLDELLDLVTSSPRIPEMDRRFLTVIRSNIILFAEVPEINANMYGWVADLANAEVAAIRWRQGEIAMGTIIGSFLAQRN